MLKKMHRRFFMLNFSILSCVLLTFLISIFFSMYRSEVNLSEEIMQDALNQFQHENAAASHSELQAAPLSYHSEEEAELYNENFDEIPFHQLDWYSSMFQPSYDFKEDEEFYDPQEDGNDQIYGPQEPATEDDKHLNDHESIEGPMPPEPTEEPQPPFAEPSSTEEPFAPEQPSDSPEWHQTSIPEQPTTRPAQTTTNPRFTSSPTRTTATSRETAAKTESQQSGSTADQGTTTTTAAPATSAKTEEESATSNSTQLPSSESAIFTTAVSKKRQNDEDSRNAARNSIVVSLDDENIISGIEQSASDVQAFDAVSKAVQEILKKNQTSGTVSINERPYRFVLKPDSHGYNLVLLDRSIELSTMSRLLLIFGIIAILGFLINFGISYLLASWTVQPIACAWEKQKQFVADASHELKAPLAVISTNTELVLSNPKASIQSQSKWLNYIKSETARMTKLVSGLLFTARSEQAQCPAAQTTFDFSALVSNVCLAFEVVVFESGKRLTSNIQNSISYNGDENNFRQLLTILMDNAVQHSVRGADISISLSQDTQSRIRLAVSNTAEDIPKEQLSHLFDRFYKLEHETISQKESSGLGLNIAKSIVQQNGGTIQAFSENRRVTMVATF